MPKIKKISGLFARRFQLMLCAVVLMTAGLGVPLVRAVTCTSSSDCQQQINNLNNQNAAAQQLLSGLQSQAANYQDAINGLQAQIDGLQQQINSNQAQQAQLQQQIASNQQQIDQKKASLADDVKTMYIDGQMTTIEELATSKNLSDYVDKEQYRTAVQNQLDDTIQQITTLQVQLQQEKQRVDQLLTTENTQNAQLSSAESQQDQLLGYDQTQQAQYNQQIASSNSNIGQLKAQLTALNATSNSQIISSGTCGGGYPAKADNPYYPGDGFGPYWGCDYSQDGSEDNWHMENRECVSYTAYMVATKYGISTSNWGNAYQWISAAESHGYTVDQTPAVGAIAIRDRDYSVPGDVGHAMYVEAVNGSDSITVAEYNESYNGTFDERTFSPSSYDSRGGMYYIHFD